ncbi:MAG: SurA N-terminal domain-containing protein [Candidatus Tantalella remota]|nr:SurA N-terminal domain-containing protein [Candidatus Tantalella remota]
MVMHILRSKKFSKRIMITLLILIIPAFLLWGVGNLANQPEPVGQIGGKNITTEDLNESIQGMKIQLLFSYYSDMNSLNQVLRNRPMLNLMAWERLVLLANARKNKITVGNNKVLAFIAGQPAFIRGGIFDKKVYTYVLRNNLSITPRQFEELVRENMQVHKFRESLLQGVYVTDAETLQAYKAMKDQAVLSYIAIDKEQFADQTSVTDSEVSAFYEENKGSFLSPEQVSVEYIELPYADVTQKNRVVETLQKIYPDLERSPDQFRQIADENGLAFGETGLFTREDVLPEMKFFKEFHETAFSLKDDDISTPVFSGQDSGAIYVLHKTGGVSPTPLPLDAVREALAKGITEKKMILLAGEKAGELRDSITSSGSTLEEQATRLELQVITTEPVSAEGYIKNVGPAEDIVMSAVKSGENQLMPPVQTVKGALLVRVDAIIPADETEFQSVKDALKNQLLVRKKLRLLDEWFAGNTSDVKLNKKLENL